MADGVDDFDLILGTALVGCMGKTIAAATVQRVEGEDGSHPTIEFSFTDGTRLVLRSLDDYDKISWVTVLSS